MAWDYRKLLMAYIDNVERQQGDDLINEDAEYYLVEAGLNQDEIDELKHVANLSTKGPDHDQV